MSAVIIVVLGSLGLALLVIAAATIQHIPEMMNIDTKESWDQR